MNCLTAVVSGFKITDIELFNPFVPNRHHLYLINLVQVLISDLSFEGMISYTRSYYYACISRLPTISLAYYQLRSRKKIIELVASVRLSVCLYVCPFPPG